MHDEVHNILYKVIYIIYFIKYYAVTKRMIMETNIVEKNTVIKYYLKKLRY